MSTSLSVGTQPLAVVTEVSDGIFAYTQPDGTWWINNTGFLVGSRGVVSIDACATEHRTRRYLDTIENITGEPRAHPSCSKARSLAPSRCSGW